MAREIRHSLPSRSTLPGGALRLRCFRRLAILSLMFSNAVLDHFQNPRNAGELPGATVKIEVSNPVCGDVLQLAVRVEGERIAEARFLCRGCTTSIACASLLTEQLRGRTLVEARSLTARTLSELLGGLPSATFHAAELAADAVETMLRNIAAKYK
jgi:nitrogen fixation NifU-like protein